MEKTLAGGLFGGTSGDALSCEMPVFDRRGGFIGNAGRPELAGL
jgi:hypothetical protein